ncbi:MAG: hypothetical protein ACSW8K_11865, partial [bacterium]
MPDAPPVTATTLPSSFNQSAIFDFLLFEILLFLFPVSAAVFVLRFFISCFWTYLNKKEALP